MCMCTHVHGIYMCVCLHLILLLWCSALLQTSGFSDCPSELPSQLVLSCFLWSKASQSCVLNSFSVFPLCAASVLWFWDYHLANGFWPCVSGPVTAPELWPQHLLDRSAWRRHRLLYGLLPQCWNTCAPPGGSFTRLRFSCLCSPSLVSRAVSSDLHCT